MTRCAWRKLGRGSSAKLSELRFPLFLASLSPESRWHWAAGGRGTQKKVQKSGEPVQVQLAGNLLPDRILSRGVMGAMAEGPVRDSGSLKFRTCKAGNVSLVDSARPKCAELVCPAGATESLSSQLFRSIFFLSLRIYSPSSPVFPV